MADDKQNPGVYGGSRVGYLEHEVENWLRASAYGAGSATENFLRGFGLSTRTRGKPQMWQREDKKSGRGLVHLDRLSLLLSTRWCGETTATRQ
jgi:hypothetical protein